MPCEKAVDMLGPTTCALPLHISPLMWWLDAAAVRRRPIKAVRRRPIEKGRFFRSNRGVNTRLKSSWDASKPTVYGRSPGMQGARQVYGVRRLCKVLARDAAVRRLREVLARDAAVRRARGAFHVRVEVAAVGGGRSRRACGGVPGQCVGGIIQRLT